MKEEASITKNDLDSWIPDMPPGPLDGYRRKSRFNWKLLKVTLEDPVLVKLKMDIWNVLEKEKEFQHPSIILPTEEQKRRSMIQLKKFHGLKTRFVTPEIINSGFIRKTKHLMAVNEALAVYNRNLSVKFALGVTLFGSALALLGTKRHRDICEKAWRGEVFGAFAITEITHGSNTKRIRTTATYDPKTSEFVIHTPDFEAAKCWVGNLGRTCTYALVFAQLLTADGENHGLHGFVVPIRDPTTLLPYPGITVGDMGEKIGLNGIDNGFILFQQYRVPKTCLLNKTGNVTDDGSYENCFSDPQKILGAALEAFTTGRIGISQEASVTIGCAVTIAVRYAAVRRQFGPLKEELPILEYPLHQWRLFPYLAAAILFRIFIIDFVDQYLIVIEDSMSETPKFLNLSTIVSEVHAIVSSCKPLLTWVCRDALQECREACGGHGFLQASNLGDLRTSHEPSVTYEGDNNVLIQQSSNWLLRQYSTDREENKNCIFGTTLFFDRFEQILNYKFSGKEPDVVSHDFISNAYEWLLCWLIKETDLHISSLQAEGVDKFTARAEAQIYRARTLSLVFAENNVLIFTWRRITKPGLDPDIKLVLEKLYYIYGLWCIDRHLSYFYQGGFAEGPLLARYVRNGLVSLCRDLTPDAVALVDAIAPPDFVLNSVIARADGNLYENLKHKICFQPGATERASWWKDALPFQESDFAKSKL